MSKKTTESGSSDLEGRTAVVTGECLTIDGGGWLGRGILGAAEPNPRVRRTKTLNVEVKRCVGGGGSR